MNRMLMSVLCFTFLAAIGVVLHQRLSPVLTEAPQARFLPVFQALPETETAQSLPPGKDGSNKFPVVNERRLAELEKSKYNGPSYREVLQPEGPRLAIKESNTDRIPASEGKVDQKKRKKTK